MKPFKSTGNILLPLILAILAPTLDAQNVIRRPGTLSEIARPDLKPPTPAQPSKKKSVARRPKAKNADTAPIELKVYTDPNTTALNALMCYDDFGGLEVCFPSCFFVVADTDTDLQLLFQDASDANVAMLQFKRYDYTNSINDLPSVKAIYQTIPGAEITDAGSTISAYAQGGDQTIYSKAFMHNGQVIMCMLTFVDAVKPSMDDFIPLLSRIFNP